MAALISLQGQPATGIGAQSPSQLFAKLDTDGDGQISQSEFETALGADGVDTSSADALFAKLDANGDGSISQSELASAKRGHVTITTTPAVRSQAGGVVRAKPARRAVVVGRRRRRDHADRHQFGRLDHHDHFLCRRQHGRDDHAGGADG